MTLATTGLLTLAIDSAGCALGGSQETGSALRVILRDGHAGCLQKGKLDSALVADVLMQSQALVKPESTEGQGWAA